MAAESNGILLFGARGQLGHELQRSLTPLGAVSPFGSSDADFRKPEMLREIVRRHRPRIIVNAAAFTAVDKAESESETAFAINATAPAILAEEAEAVGACLVHYSTDYVFDGKKNTPYVETDPVNPLSVYGRSKAEGEQAVGANRRHLTFRTSWVVGTHGNNFVKTMLRLAGEREELRVVADQIGAPTSAALLADVTARILAKMADQSADDARWGLYHLVAVGETSWYALARHVVARAGQMGYALKTKPEAIVPITAADYASTAARPANSRLDTSKLRTAFAVTLPDWSAGVDDVLDGIVAAAP